MAITAVEEIALVAAFKNVLENMLDSDDRKALDPRNNDYSPSRARKYLSDAYLPWALAHSGLHTMPPEERIVYIDRFMRQMPQLLDATVTADNTASLTD